MKTVDEIKTKIKEYYELQSEEYASRYDMLRYNGAIEALLWVLGNDIKPEGNEVKDIIKNFNEQFKQLTIFDIIGDEDEKEN